MCIWTIADPKWSAGWLPFHRKCNNRVHWSALHLLITKTISKQHFLHIKIAKQCFWCILVLKMHKKRFFFIFSLFWNFHMQKMLFWYCFCNKQMQRASVNTITALSMKRYPTYRSFRICNGQMHLIYTSKMMCIRIKKVLNDVQAGEYCMISKLVNCSDAQCIHKVQKQYRNSISW